jgi:hypothetical protein
VSLSQLAASLAVSRRMAAILVLGGGTPQAVRPAVATGLTLAAPSRAAVPGRRPAGYWVAARRLRQEAVAVRRVPQVAVVAQRVPQEAAAPRGQRAVAAVRRVPQEAEALRGQRAAAAARCGRQGVAVRAAAAAELRRAVEVAARAAVAGVQHAAAEAAGPVSPRLVSVGCLLVPRPRRLSPPSPQG